MDIVNGHIHITTYIHDVPTAPVLHHGSHDVSPFPSSLPILFRLIRIWVLACLGIGLRLRGRSHTRWAIGVGIWDAVREGRVRRGSGERAGVMVCLREHDVIRGELERASTRSSAVAEYFAYREQRARAHRGRS